MNKMGLLALAAQFAPRITAIRRRTWIFIGLAVAGVLGLLVWVAFSVLSWMWGQAQGLSANVPEMAKSGVEEARQRIEQTAPGLSEKLGEFAPALKQEAPPRDVSGTDVAPVSRYPGLARVYWHREGKTLTVEFAGQADYSAVLAHYLNGFAAQGYTQQVLSAQPNIESHAFSGQGKRYALSISSADPARVVVRIETELNAGLN